MATWYVTKQWPTQILPVEVEGETDKFVIIKDRSGKSRRNAKLGGYESYYPTWQAAHDSLLERATNILQGARRRLDEAEKEYGEISRMVQP